MAGSDSLSNDSLSRIEGVGGGALEDSKELQLSELPGIKEPEAFKLIRSENVRPNNRQ